MFSWSNFVKRPSVLCFFGDAALVHKYLHIRILGPGTSKLFMWYIKSTPPWYVDRDISIRNSLRSNFDTSTRCTYSSLEPLGSTCSRARYLYVPGPKIRICRYLCTRAASPKKQRTEGLLMKLLQKNKRCTWSQDTYMSVPMYQGYIPPPKNNRRPIDEIAQKK